MWSLHSQANFCQGCPNVFDIGTQIIIWPGLWAESVKITTSGIPNRLNSCVVFTVEQPVIAQYFTFHIQFRRLIIIIIIITSPSMALQSNADLRLLNGILPVHSVF